ncbi:MAG: Cob(I)yrinic acid a,c-diamide adenosyltransferase [Phycisphaerae bacterium]|nr:Cob(I)yrinic acid a,c-diamide adenosyltransferase [Phycisphaerae bacterium]
MKLYTRSGDDGTTGLFGGKRVLKNIARVQAYGEVDETNALLGWAAVVCQPLLAERIKRLQDQLFTLGTELATPPENLPIQGIVPLADAQVTELEQWIDEATDPVPPLRQFILPGGAESSARLQVARAVSRRAERGVVALAQVEPVRAIVIHYLNRLSDLLFAWARWENWKLQQPEILWTPRNHP